MKSDLNYLFKEYKTNVELNSCDTVRLKLARLTFGVCILVI